jgi:hypothetical protein
LRGGSLAPALLFTALGLALAFAPRRVWVPSLIALVAAMSLMALASPPRNWLEGIFLLCWLSVAITAAAVHLRHGLRLWEALLLSFNAGAWACAVIALSASPIDLLRAAPWALIFLPASWLIRRGGGIAIKVVSSWVIAVAILAGTLQLLPVTPGYLPDHLD